MLVAHPGQERGGGGGKEEGRRGQEREREAGRETDEERGREFCDISRGSTNSSCTSSVHEPEGEGGGVTSGHTHTLRHISKSTFYCT